MFTSPFEFCCNLSMIVKVLDVQQVRSFCNVIYHRWKSKKRHGVPLYLCILLKRHWFLKEPPKEPTGHILFSRCLCRPHTKQEELYRNLRRKDHLEANSVHTTEVPQEINFTIFSYSSSKHALLLPSKDLHYMHVMEEDHRKISTITLVCVQKILLLHMRNQLL